MSDEPVEVVDPDTLEVIEVLPRGEVGRRRLWHRVSAVLVRNGRGEVYLHRRTSTKSTFPSFHDVWAGGVMAPGEAPGVAAARELAEELGIEGAALEPLGRYRYEGEAGRALWWLYAVTWDGAVFHQPEEVADGWWVSIDQLQARLADRAWPFVPDGREVLEALIGGRLAPPDDS